MVEKNDRFYVPEEKGLQLLDRAKKSKITQGEIGQLLKPKVSQSLVGQILKGYSTTTVEKIVEIEKIIEKAEKATSYRKKQFATAN